MKVLVTGSAGFIGFTFAKSYYNKENSLARSLKPKMQKNLNVFLFPFFFFLFSHSSPALDLKSSISNNQNYQLIKRLLDMQFSLYTDYDRLLNQIRTYNINLDYRPKLTILSVNHWNINNIIQTLLCENLVLIALTDKLTTILKSLHETNHGVLTRFIKYIQNLFCC